MNFFRNDANALKVLRLAAAAMMFIHGAARISLGIVDDLGGFFASYGIPFGFYIAWAITLFEIIGSVLLAAGFYTSIISALFAVQLVVGIILIHSKDGWFVVGAGRNGMEYSLLLVIIFAVIGLNAYKRK